MFTWDGVAWKGVSQGAPVTVYVSDTAPLSPAIGQLWWNSATGTMAIWYADSDSAQWVQVSGQVLPTAPSDNGEYVMCNGVWRLVRQSYNLAGLSTTTGIDIAVPAWGPKQARLTGRIWPQSSALNTSVVMRMSIDGTTFPGGGSEYSNSGFVHRVGTASPGIIPLALTATPHLIVMGGAMHLNIPGMFVAYVGLTRETNADYFQCSSHATTYSVTAANLYETDFYSGYAQLATFAGADPLKALRLFSQGNAPRAGTLSVDWLQ